MLTTPDVLNSHISGRSLRRQNEQNRTGSGMTNRLCRCI